MWLFRHGTGYVPKIALRPDPCAIMIFPLHVTGFQSSHRRSNTLYATDSRASASQSSLISAYDLCLQLRTPAPLVSSNRSHILFVVVWVLASDKVFEYLVETGRPQLVKVTPSSWRDQCSSDYHS